MSKSCNNCHQNESQVIAVDCCCKVSVQGVLKLLKKHSVNYVCVPDRYLPVGCGCLGRARAAGLQDSYREHAG